MVTNPKIKTKVIHSESNSAWNVVGKEIGRKYKIARVPYITSHDEKVTEQNRSEAFVHAQFIAYCFNHSDFICKNAQ